MTSKKSREDLEGRIRRLWIFFDFVPYPIVIFTRRGRVYYVNPAFTKTFGWTRKELRGGIIPWTPPNVEGLPAENLKNFFENDQPRRYETKRISKDGRVIDVIVRTVSYSGEHGKATGILMIQRDVTQEKREIRIRETMHRISLKLPEYPDLRELLDFIVEEVRQLTESEAANVLLYDEERSELVFFVTAHENQALSECSKEARFSLDQLMAGNVIKTGRPRIGNQASESGPFSIERDAKLGYPTRSVVQVPLWSGERIIGILVAANKKKGEFEQSDINLLNTIGSTVALSIENARYSSELQKAYQEVRSLNHAKNKLIDHLSHELKTPVSILSGSMSILTKHLSKLPDTNWQKNFERKVTCLFKSQEAVFIPREALEIIVDGLIKNAIENTPDGGKVEISVQQKGKGAMLEVRDYGVGMLEDAQKRIFEGFFPTHETLSYSSKRPFDFNAGGKGADLLRMKIFSERYGFKIDMFSTRCLYIPKKGENCLGSIQDCPHCSAVSDCHQSGGSAFSLYFPPQTKQKANGDVI